MNLWVLFSRIPRHSWFSGCKKNQIVEVQNSLVEKKNTGYNIKKEEKFSRNFVKTKK